MIFVTEYDLETKQTTGPSAETPFSTIAEAAAIMQFSQVAPEQVRRHFQLFDIKQGKGLCISDLRFA